MTNQIIPRKIKSVMAEAEKSNKFIHHGGTVTWSLEQDLIDYLEDYLWQGAYTAETGVGVSTLMFCLKGCKHITISPVEDEFNNVCQLAKGAGISTENVTFYQGMSEDVLPKIDLNELDVALVDGGHGFPVPFVDWMYFAKKLKVGGLIVIDDIQIWTGAILRDFLAADENWSLVRDFGKSVVFKKLNENFIKDWGGQPFVVAQSAIPSDWPWLRNVAIGLASNLSNVVNKAKALPLADLDKPKDIQKIIDKLKGVIVDFEDLSQKVRTRKPKDPNTVAPVIVIQSAIPSDWSRLINVAIELVANLSNIVNKAMVLPMTDLDKPEFTQGVIDKLKGIVIDFENIQHKKVR